MKQAHRAAIIAALAGAGLLVSNVAFGAANYTEHQVKEKRSRTQLVERESNIGLKTAKPNKPNKQHRSHRRK